MTVLCKDCRHRVPDPNPMDPGRPWTCDDCGRDMLDPYGFCAWVEPVEDDPTPSKPSVHVSYVEALRREVAELRAENAGFSSKLAMTVEAVEAAEDDAEFWEGEHNHMEDMFDSAYDGLKRLGRAAGGLIDALRSDGGLSPVSMAALESFARTVDGLKVLPESDGENDDEGILP